MTVLFYTATCYLDISLEVINVLKTVVDLHVLIEIHPGTKNMNIVDLDHLPGNKTLIKPSELLSKEHYRQLEPYFNGVRSTHFAVHPKKSALSSFKASCDIFRFIKRIKPDVLHLEALFLIRTISLVPSIFFFKKLVMSIHDPVPHSGEKDWKETILKFIYFHLPIKKSYLFYSHFAKSLFETQYQKIRAQKGILQMSSYSYFKKLKQPGNTQAKHILFFGRLSKYKGIDILLEAMPDVFKEFPNELLVVAGRTINGYKINENITGRYSQNISLINKHLSNEELVQLISASKFIVCPYIDATQSGVLMTAFALNTPVIASNVGAFPEYISESVNGLLVPAGDSGKLAEKITQALRGDFYLDMKKNIEIDHRNKWLLNESILLKAYLS